MTRRQIIVACSVLLSATSLFAQAGGAKASADPITGTWTGTLLIQQSEPRTVPITMELKFDGKSAVSGTFTGLPTPGDVKTGTFDPKKGTLKLQLGKTGEAAVLLVLEGAVVKDTATGQFKGDHSGEFKLTKKS